MGFSINLNDILKNREEKGISISYTVDITSVEGLFKKVFGIKTDMTGLDQKAIEQEEKDNGGQNSNS